MTITTATLKSNGAGSPDKGAQAQATLIQQCPKRNPVNSILALRKGVAEGEILTKVGITDDLQQKVDEAVQQAYKAVQDQANPAARGIFVNFSAECIEYAGPDGKNHFLPESKVPEALRQLMKTIAQIAERTVSFRRSREFGGNNNRPLDGKPPFQPTTQKWAAYNQGYNLPRHFEENHGELNNFLEQNNPDLAESAPVKIHTAHMFCAAMRHYVIEKIKKDEKEFEKEYANEPWDQKKKEKQQQINSLKNWEKKIAESNQQVIFYSAACLDGFGKGPPTEETQRKNAKRTEEAIFNNLTKNRGEIGSPTIRDMKKFSVETGATHIPNLQDYEQKIAAEQQKPCSGSFELLATQSLYMLNQKLGQEEMNSALSSLGISPNDPVVPGFSECFGLAMDYTNKYYKQAEQEINAIKGKGFKNQNEILNKVEVK